MEIWKEFFETDGLENASRRAGFERAMGGSESVSQTHCFGHDSLHPHLVDARIEALPQGLLGSRQTDEAGAVGRLGCRRGLF